jgi:hypothetical protein
MHNFAQVGRWAAILVGGFLAIALAGRAAAAAPKWLDDYAQAHRRAEQQGKYLLIYFTAKPNTPTATDPVMAAVARPQVRDRLEDFVLVRLSLDATVQVDGQRAAWPSLILPTRPRRTTGRWSAWYGCVRASTIALARRMYRFC